MYLIYGLVQYNTVKAKKLYTKSFSKCLSNRTYKFYCFREFFQKRNIDKNFNINHAQRLASNLEK